MKRAICRVIALSQEGEVADVEEAAEVRKHQLIFCLFSLSENINQS